MAPIRTQQISGNIDVDNLTVHAGLLVDAGAVITGITTTPVAPYTISGAPPANANQAALEIGGGVFDGVSAGKFAGYVNGAALGINLPLGNLGWLMSLQVGGTEKFRVDNSGNIVMSNGSVIATFGGNAMTLNGATVQINGNIGFYNAAPVGKPTVNGSKAANAALTSLMTALSTLGLVTDSTT